LFLEKYNIFVTSGHFWTHLNYNNLVKINKISNLESPPIVKTILACFLTMWCGKPHPKSKVLEMRIYEDIVKNVSNMGKNDFFLVVVEKKN